MAKQAATRASGTSSTSRKKSSPPAAPTVSLLAPEPSHAEIAARAYGLYLSRGPHQGDAFDDWLRAEQELRKEPKN